MSDDESRPATHDERPVDTRRHDSPSADLELLAKWLRSVDPRRASPLETTIASSGPRVEREDERTHEWHRAMAISRRLESLRTGAGCTHYAVLEWLFLTRGPECRLRWKDPLEKLGEAFAPPEKLAAWNAGRRCVKTAGLRRLGERLYDDAIAAYARTK